MSTTNPSQSLSKRLHATCAYLNEDKAFHEQTGHHQWHLDTGKLESVLNDHGLFLTVDKTPSKGAPNNPPRDPQTILEQYAAINAWMPATQVAALVDFIRSQSLVAQLESYLSDKVDFETCYTPSDAYGMDAARKAIKEDPGLTLYECDINRHHVKVHVDVYIASTDPGQAMELAEAYAQGLFDNEPAWTIECDGCCLAETP